MILSALFFIKIGLEILESFLFPYKIIYSSSMKNTIGILIGTALNQ